MSDQPKRRRRRRRRRGSEPVAVAPIVAGEDEDAGPIEPGKLRGGSITLDVPLRFLEILEWGARSKRLPVEQFALEILRGVLSGMKPAFREATTGRVGGTVTKAGLARLVDD